MAVGVAWLGMAFGAYQSASAGRDAGHSDLGFWWTVIGALLAYLTPLVIWPAATGGTLDAPRMAAAAVTLAVGYMVKNVLAAIFSGAATLYLLLFLLGG